MVAKLIGAAEASLSGRNAGDTTQLTYPDYLLVMSLIDKKRFKLAQAIMEYRLKVRAREAQQINMQNVQANADAQNQSLMTKGKMDENLIRVEGEEDRKGIQEKGRQDRQTQSQQQQNQE